MSTTQLRDALTRLSANHSWTWDRETRRILDELPGASGAAHPHAAVNRLDDSHLEGLASQADFMARVESAVARLDSLRAVDDPQIAYLSPEYGLTARLPQYAGGLGILAGDHLKTASDLEMSLAGVGVFYRDGIFRQSVEDHQQKEVYRPVTPEEAGAVDTGITVQVPFPGREVAARVWRLEVGRIPLILLDTQLEDNSSHDRDITDKLYIGFKQHRIDQEMILGVGGARALAELGWTPTVHHLNEGHAGFIVLELIDRVIEDGNVRGALDWVREGLVFTTHTPVPAGIDKFDAELIVPYLQTWAERWDVAVEEVWALGADPEDESKFNMAAMCLRASRTSNGVSRLHGEVSRGLFAGVGIGDEIDYVTNGVHARSWTADHTQALFDEFLGDGWAHGSGHAWERVAEISDQALIDTRVASSTNLATLVADRTGSKLDPEALIVGFARRFAPYKRATLLLRRPDLLESMLSDDSQPVHFVFAGKAHPTDSEGKALVSELLETAAGPAAHNRIVFVPDYDMDVGLAMVQGADIWLNNPIRPREASGTSGEKAVLNGSLNCSILDGWWAEMYDGDNGWEIPASRADDPGERDHEESTAMLTTLAAIRDEYYRARPVLLGRIRHAWRTLGPKVNSVRMLNEYRERIYRL